MKTIYRYPLQNLGLNIIRTYKNCKILSAGLDPRGDLSIWILIDTKEEMNKDLKIFVAGTGWDFEPAMNNPIHVDTVKQNPCMWHVFYESDEILDRKGEKYANK